MQVPAGIYRARTALETSIPRDSVPQIVTHTAIFAIGGGGAAIGASTLLPTRREAGPGGYARTDFLDDAATGLTAGGLLLFTLTAGAQLATPGGVTLAKGISPFYSMAIGAGIGGGMIVKPVADALGN